MNAKKPLETETSVFVEINGTLKPMGKIGVWVGPVRELRQLFFEDARKYPFPTLFITRRCS